MGGETLCHFKTSLSCHIPAYIVDSGEVLRALPAHILRRRCYEHLVEAASESHPMSKKFCNKTLCFAPKVPSPLRQSTLAERSDDGRTEEVSARDCNTSVSLGMFCDYTFNVVTDLSTIIWKSLREERHNQSTAPSTSRA